MSSGRKYRIARPVGPGACGNRCIIPLTCGFNFDLTADVARGFAFDTSNFYVGGGINPIPGAAEVQAVFSMMRIHKVEMTILPKANVLAYNDQSLSSGQTNIPYVYHAIDYQDGNNPTITEIQQNPTCKTNSLDKVIRRTFYPRIEGSNGVIDVGQNRRNIFQESGVTSTQKYHGIKLYIDMNSEVWTYGGLRVVFKVYFECMQSK